MIISKLLILRASLLFTTNFAQLSFLIQKAQINQDGSIILQKTLNINNNANGFYVMTIKIGKLKTKINVQLDTDSQVLWFASKTCQGCETNYPNRYDCLANDGCMLSSKSDEQVFGDGTDISGTIGQVPVLLNDGTKIDNQYFLLVTRGQNIVSGQDDGIFGLGTADPYNDKNQYQNWVNILFVNKIIAANQFSLYLDDAGFTQQGSNSRLMLGSYDQQYYSPNLVVSLAKPINKPSSIPFQTPSSNSFPLWAKIMIPIAGCLIIATIGYLIYYCVKYQSLYNNNSNNSKNKSNKTYINKTQQLRSKNSNNHDSNTPLINSYQNQQ